MERAKVDAEKATNVDAIKATKKHLLSQRVDMIALKDPRQIEFLNKQFNDSKWSTDILAKNPYVMKHKKVKSLVNYHQFSNEEREAAMNYISKDAIQKTETKAFHKLSEDLKMCNRHLYKLCNLFEFLLSFENFAECYNSAGTTYDKECLKRAGILNFIERNIG